MKRAVAAALLAAVCSASADVQIELAHPLAGARFSTNNPTLILEGRLLSDGGPLLLSIDAAAAPSALDGSETHTSELVLDAGQQLSAEGVVFQPVIEQTERGWKSYGPRIVEIWTGNAGASPSAVLVCPSGVGDPRQEASIRFDNLPPSRFYRLRWKEGWQRRPDGTPHVRLKGVALMGGSAQIVQTAAFFAQADSEVTFRRTVQLRPGANRIRLSVQQLETEERADAELEAELADPFGEGTPEETVVLSDGSGLTIEMPPGSVDETMRGLRLIRMDPQETPLASYRGHRLIDDRRPPFAAYRFEGLFQTAFEAEASASLPGQPASLAADGRTAYPSTWIAARAPFPISWKVDLGRVETIGRVVVRAHQERGVSYSPSKASIWLSADGVRFQLAQEVDQFNDRATAIDLPPGLSGRWAELLIEEGKAGHTVQINEIEFYDASGARIAAQESQSEIPFLKPALAAVSVPPSAEDQQIGLFFLDASTNRWEWTRSAQVGGLFLFETNALAPLALFQMRSTPSDERNFTVQWSLNPFSPNGDGKADRSRLFLNMGGNLQNRSVWYTVKIYDLRGMLIRTLADRAKASAGAMSVEWDGVDRNGQAAPIGAYVYSAQAHVDDVKAAAAVFRGLIVIAR